MRPLSSAIALAMVAQVALAQGSVSVSARSGGEREVQAVAQLQKILTTYDLAKWTFTRKVVIERGARPHSHPVLTLNTRHLDNDLQQLSNYLHEQMHWFLSGRSRPTNQAIRDLEKAYTNVPVGPPDGADSKRSTYLHLLVNYLEWTALKQLAGDAAAREVFEVKTTEGYRWIYRTVLSDEAAIAAIVTKHKLQP